MHSVMIQPFSFSFSLLFSFFFFSQFLWWATLLTAALSCSFSEQALSVSWALSSAAVNLPSWHDRQGFLNTYSTQPSRWLEWLVTQSVKSQEHRACKAQTQQTLLLVSKLTAVNPSTLVSIAAEDSPSNIVDSWKVSGKCVLPAQRVHTHTHTPPPPKASKLKKALHLLVEEYLQLFFFFNCMTFG